MANIINVIIDLLKPYQTTIIAFFSLIIFSLLAYYAYNNYYLPYQKKMKSADVANNPNRLKIVNIFFFFVDWCPHCKTAKPEWNNFKIQYNDREVNGYKIKCYDINCTEDNGTIEIEDIPSDAKNVVKTTPIVIADLINKYKIDAYPTIKMVKDDYTIDNDSKINADYLDKFVHTAI